MSHKYDSDGNLLKHKREGADSSQEKPHLAHLSYTNVPNTPGELMATAVWFLKFLHRDNGYLKVKREPDSSSVHFTWTWTLGPHTKSYVYVRAEYWQAKYAIEVLERKLMDVEEGLRPGTRDRYNG